MVATGTMLICMEAAQAVLEGVLAGLTLRLDDETEFCPLMLADLALKLNKTDYSTPADEMEYSPRQDEMEDSPHADVDMVSPLSDSRISELSKTGSEESDGVYASDYACTHRYMRRRHPSQDVRHLESPSDSSFRQRSRLAISPAPHVIDHFHHKKA